MRFQEFQESLKLFLKGKETSPQDYHAFQKPFRRTNAVIHDWRDMNSKGGFPTCQKMFVFPAKGHNFANI